MYKKQLTVQKILCIAAVIVSAVVFLYALGIMTDLYDALYDTMRNPNDVFQTDVPGSIVYYNMQDFNNYFLKYSIGLILLAVLLFITNTHVRRKYYILQVLQSPFSDIPTLKSSRGSSFRWILPHLKNTRRCGARSIQSPRSGLIFITLYLRSCSS